MSEKQQNNIPLGDSQSTQPQETSKIELTETQLEALAGGLAISWN